MAILKSKTLVNGSVGSYWKISWLSINKTLLTYDCVLTLYADKSFADIGASLSMDKQYRFQITKEDLALNVVALGYTKIMDDVVASGDPDLTDGAES